MPRERLLFAGGLDRATGIMALNPVQSKDCRNVYLVAGRMEARRGHGITLTLPDGDDIAGGCDLKSEQAGIVVGYNHTTGQAKVYRVSGEGTVPILIGTWFTDAGGPTPPRVRTAEVYGKVFLAHEEFSITLRKNTIYYDSADGLLHTLTASLDGAAAAPVKFLGVRQYLNYLVGWGYGSATEPNRPEMVRISLPAEPTSFHKNHYFIAGSRNDPVITCAQSNDLKVLKQSESYRISGFAKSNFGILPSDKLFGAGGGGLAVSVGGDLYYWSLEGPRVYRGSSSEDLALPLGLPDDEPNDLPEARALADGFAVYEPERRIVRFTFGRRQYSLHLKDGAEKWSYDELGFEPQCGFILYSGLAGAGASEPPEADASAVTLSSISATTAKVSWNVAGAVGDEWYEVWVKATGGNWFLIAQGHTNGGPSESANLSGLSAGVNYSLAIRYRRGSRYEAAYSSGEPSDWPAAARASFATLMLPPTGLAISWLRLNASTERFIVRWTNRYSNRQVRVLLNEVTIATLSAGTTQYNIDNPGGEQTHNIQVRHVNGDIVGTGVSSNVWAGPTGTSPGLIEVTSPFQGWYRVLWNPKGLGFGTSIEDSRNAGQFREAATASPNDTQEDVDAGGIAASGRTYAVRMRFRAERFGVVDYGPYSGVLPVTIQ